jgi:hypothetical protein
MSHPHQQPAYPPMVAEPARVSRQRPTLWVAPLGLAGLQLPTAMSGGLPTGQRLALLAAVVVVFGGAGIAAGALDQPELVPLVMSAGFIGILLALRWSLAHKRRSFGLVRTTPLQFDLVVALAQLPADRIDQGRQLHDRLVWLLQQPTPDPVAVQQCEGWMAQLATGRWP